MKVIKGNLLNQKHGILCHQVNLRGVMGAGLALQIAEKWEHVADDYANYCSHEPRLGDVYFAEAQPNLVIANLFGQADVSRDRCVTDYTVYPAMLETVREEAELLCLPIFIPWGIGCGIAGGNWQTMFAIIEKHLPMATLIKL